MDKKTKGAWLLSQSKLLGAVTGASRLENISYAGGIGRLYNLLRRDIPNVAAPTISAQAVARACQLNNIDRPTREHGLQVLAAAGRIDVASDGSISVLGASSTAVLEATADIFDAADPTGGEKAVLDLSEAVAARPMARNDAIELIGDTHKIKSSDASSLVDLCHEAAILDQESDRGSVFLFNSNTFRDGQYAKKAKLLLDNLTAAEQSRLSEVQEKLTTAGVLSDSEVHHILGDQLYQRVVGIGLFDRMEVSNSSEAVGYIASPNDFQKFGRPFEDDPVDDAKALLASLTYGRTRSDYARGNVVLPDALLSALINGREVGGQTGVRAIGEDYRELEVRQVVRVREVANGRYRMTLLKKDVGELARTIIRGGKPAQEAILLGGQPATSFAGPHDTRKVVRQKNSVGDKRFIAQALDRLRSGG